MVRVGPWLPGRVTRRSKWVGQQSLSPLPGIFMLLLIFFAFLHCWLNAFAEMLRFGDRMFYRVGPGPELAGNWQQEE